MQVWKVGMNGGAVTKWMPTHKAGLATAEDTRHCFHGVVNLTNVCSTQVHGED